MLKPETAACLEASITVGDVIADKYVIRSILGQGGMGLVCEAEHRQLGERVAIKLLTSGSDRVPAARARFMREARVTARLRGEHTARVSDYGVLDDGTPYMVMEYLEGLDLRRVLRDETTLPVDVAVHYTVQACVGLAEAHAMGIVHRDLKPSNLFVTERPDGSDLIKIVDFGVSKTFSMAGTDDDLTASGTILGSPRYMAPEQLEDSVRVDARADIWSLGAVLYEMLAGRPCFTASSPAGLCHAVLGGDRPPPIGGRGVTPELEAVVFACLERDPDARIADVGVLARALFEATGLDGLDAAASRTEGILQRAPASELTSSRSLEGMRDPRRRVGSSSSVSQVGPVAHTLPPRAKRSVAWIAVPAAVLIAIALLTVGLIRRNVDVRAIASSSPPSLGPSAGVVAVATTSALPTPPAALNDAGVDIPREAPPSSGATPAAMPRSPASNAPGAAAPAPTVRPTAVSTAIPSPSRTHDPFDDRF